MFSLKWSFESCYQAQFHPDFIFFLISLLLAKLAMCLQGWKYLSVSQLVVRPPFWSRREYFNNCINDCIDADPLTSSSGIMGNYFPLTLIQHQYHVEISVCPIVSTCNRLLITCTLSPPVSWVCQEAAGGNHHCCGKLGSSADQSPSKRLLALPVGVPERVRQRLRDLLLLVLH